MTDFKAGKPDTRSDIPFSGGQTGKMPLPPEEELSVQAREADQAKIAAIAADIDFADPSLTIAYGARTMADIAKFADALLVQVRARDAGPVGQVLSALLGRIKDMNIAETAGQEPGWAARLPLLGGLFDPMTKAQARFNTLADGVDSVVVNLQEAMTRLLRDIEVMDQLYELNREFHHELTLAIAAGKKRLEEAYAEDLPRLQDKARQAGEADPDNMAAQAVRDFADKLNRFERRLYDLQLARAVTLQTAPQIRLIQGNDQTLAEKIQAGILTAIPVWKAQMVLALSLHGQKQAARLQQDVTDTTNELLRKNAELLRDATIDTARETERGVVDIESLRAVHDMLLDTVEETLRIATEARDKRREVEKELHRMEGDLRDRLTDLAQRKGTQNITAAEDAAPRPPDNAPPSPNASPRPLAGANPAAPQPDAAPRPDSPSAPNAAPRSDSAPAPNAAPRPEAAAPETPPARLDSPELKRGHLDCPELKREHLDCPELKREHITGSQLGAPSLEEPKKPASAPIAMSQGGDPTQSGPPIAMGRGGEPGQNRE